MSPLTYIAPHDLSDVAQQGDQLWVAHDHGVTLLDSDGEVLRSIATPLRRPQLHAFSDGRTALLQSYGPCFWIRNGQLEPIEVLAKGARLSVAETNTLFACTDKSLLVDDGASRTFSVDLSRPHAVVTTPDGILLLARYGWALLSEDGAIRNQGKLKLARVFRTKETYVAVEGTTLRPFAALRSLGAPLPVEFNDAIPFAGGALCIADDAIRLVDVDEEGLRLRWRIDVESAAKRCWAGDFAVIELPEFRQCLFVSPQSDVTRVTLDSRLRQVCFREGEVALGTERSLHRWRPGADTLEPLEYDAAPSLRVLPSGFASLEGEVLRVFDARDRPPLEPTFAVADPELGAPVVVGGFLGTRITTGRYAYMLEHNGRRFRIRRGTPFRPALDQETASALMTRLCARECDASIPTPPDLGPDRSAIARGWPPEVMATLQQRAWFDGDLSDAERILALQMREGLLSELALALRTSPRCVLAAIRAGAYPLTPARAIPKHEYLGSFQTKGNVCIADPCYAARPRFRLELKVAPGEWFVFVRPWVDPTWGNRNGELIVVHERGYAIAATTAVDGFIGVDSGTAGVFDVACEVPDATEAMGVTIDGRGVFVSSGLGDGGYAPYVGRESGAIVKIRLPFIDPLRDDRSVAVEAQPDETSEPYSPRKTFAVATVIVHKKFGSGRVIAATKERIEVAFSDETRTLVHGR